MRLGTLMRGGAIHASLSRRARAFLMVSLPTDNLVPEFSFSGQDIDQAAAENHLFDFIGYCFNQ